ncbi:aspartyl-phosphate phosphatase Spo0E family protein [Gorillibacterium sp. sgz5001074]|uniref:aspartyl-phosphate phosphatase Spo0E family protein n=1 Tax=Gorillibacterium sp. sgz5001074 TaxID=3446695 RepID=UPI003F678152
MNRNHENIEFLKRQLIQVAEKHFMNLLHPEVVACSQLLDLYIVNAMKAQYREVS